MTPGARPQRWTPPRWRCSGPPSGVSTCSRRSVTAGAACSEAARPGAVPVVFAETSDGVALVLLPAAAGGRLPARAERLANAAAAALAEAASLPHPVRAGDAEIEAARWRGPGRAAHGPPRPGDVLELLPLTLEDQAEELDRVAHRGGAAARRRPRRDGARCSRSAGCGAPRWPPASAAGPERRRSRPRSRPPSPASRPGSPRRPSVGPGDRRRSAAPPPRRAAHAPPARRDGQVRRLPHGVPPPRARLRGPRAGARARGRRGAPARRLPGREAVGRPAPRLARRGADERHPRARRARHLRGAAAEPAGAA